MATKLWKLEQGWSKLPAKELKTLEAYCGDYVEFISRAKTERLAHDMALDLAKKAGFVNIDDVIAKKKTLKPGDKVYRSCRGKTLFLAQIGKQPLEKGLALVGAHIDSPRLDAKPNPICEQDELVYIDTHYYGGIKKYQWYTIPLALYGVIFRRDGSKVNVAIGDKPSDPVFTITDLLPHLDHDRETMTIQKAFPGEALNVLIASRPVDKKNDEKDVKDKIEKTNNVEAAAYLGKVIAKKALDKGIKEVVFDRSGYIYQGKVAALAEAAREAGLEF